MGNYLVIAAIAALLLFRLYRRGRSLIGEQPYSEKKMRRRLLSLAVVLALLLWDDWNLAHAALANASPALATALLYMLLGIGGGAVLGVWAARLAELRRDAGTLKLRGHAWFGPAILVLYALRLVYRFWLMHRLGLMSSGTFDPAHAMLFQREMAEYVLNPLSSLLRGLVFAYYFTYYPLLMRRATRMQETPAAALPDQP